MTIPYEAVQAAIRAWFEDTRPETADISPLPEQARRMRLALTAALPFLQGVKVESIETAPKHGDEFLARCGEEWPWFSCFWDGSEFVHYDRTDGIVHYPVTEWLPMPERILSAIEPSPSPRAQALEEAAMVAEARKPLYTELQARNACAEIASSIRALSSQPVPDGWMPIETAPKDTYVLAWGDNFHWRGVEKAYVHSDYNGHVGVICKHGVAGTPFSGRDAPTHWRPLPASPGASE